jgi:carbonic anhydrase
MLPKILSVLILVVFATYCSGQVWNYDDTTPEGPSHWADGYPICGQSSQSPIDINKKIIRTNRNLGDFKYTGYDVTPATFTLQNNGHSAELDVPDNSITISNGDLASTYTLKQFHFHWVGSNGVGSEHTINGASTPLEIHLVHWNSDYYANFTEASDKPDGIAVVGILVQVGDPSFNDLNPALGGLTDDFNNVLHEGDHYESTPFQVRSLLPSNRTYFRYSGSLTTPPCYQSVTWTLFQTPIYISQAQMDKFRTLLTENDVVLDHNNRPIQPINNRVVYQSPVLTAP